MTLATLLVFFFLNMASLLVGFILGRGKAMDADIIQLAYKNVRKVLNKGKSGVIDYVTPEQTAYANSYESKVDEARTKLWSTQIKI